MDWQDYVVWAIGIAVAALLVRRVVCALRGTSRGRCSSCTADCPVKRMKNEISRNKGSGKH